MSTRALPRLLNVSAWVLGALLLAAPPPAEVSAAPGRLATTDDIHQLASDARAASLPILLLVSSSECPYCVQLKREVLDPMVLSGDYRDRVIMRELLLDEPFPVRDFDGADVDRGKIARRYRAWLTPTVLFLDPEGRELTERIRGISNIDYYGYYLDQAIDNAGTRLRESR